MTGLPKDTFKPYIYSGNMRYMMELQEPRDVLTPTGAHTTVWDTIADEVWIELIPLHGTQMYYAQSFAPKATSILRCRYRIDTVAGMRLIFAPHAYLIIHPPLDLEGQRAVLLLYCQELRVGTPPT